MSNAITNNDRRIHFAWILSPGKDLLFYIGSALAGWLYVGIVAWAIHAFEDPLNDLFGTMTFGGVHIPLNLNFLVVISWAFILDAPHVWGTLARTLFDPDEWAVRKKEILFSFIWFLVGPIFILGPYFFGSVTARFDFAIAAGKLALGATIFFVFFRLWAYYHVVRQHWGFFALYKRRSRDYGAWIDKIDKWFFNLSLYLPLIMFMTSPFYNKTPGFPPIGLHMPIAAGISFAEVIYPVAWLSYLMVLTGYVVFQLKLWLSGATLNGSKLLYMLLIVPLHFIAFSHPIMAVFIVPLVTVGHNIQYHCIVYSYGQNKYRRRSEKRYTVAKLLFSNFAMYAFVGLIFTFALYRGPWIDWLKSMTGLKLDVVMLNSIGMMAGIKDPASLGLGEQACAAFITGFAMQHYYLDSKIWRVSKDKDVQKNLNV